jgi:hypothetical protein
MPTFGKGCVIMSIPYKAFNLCCLKMVKNGADLVYSFYNLLEGNPLMLEALRPNSWTFNHSML